jgi:hypothetical protein
MQIEAVNRRSWKPRRRVTVCSFAITLYFDSGVEKSADFYVIPTKKAREIVFK